MYYDNYTTNYNQWIRFNYQPGSILLYGQISNHVLYNNVVLHLSISVNAITDSNLEQYVSNRSQVLSLRGEKEGRARWRKQSRCCALYSRCTAVVSHVWRRLSLWLHYCHWVTQMCKWGSKLPLKALKTLSEKHICTDNNLQRESLVISQARCRAYYFEVTVLMIHL